MQLKPLIFVSGRVVAEVELANDAGFGHQRSADGSKQHANDAAAAVCTATSEPQQLHADEQHAVQHPVPPPVHQQPPTKHLLPTAAAIQQPAAQVLQSAATADDFSQSANDVHSSSTSATCLFSQPANHDCRFWRRRHSTEPATGGCQPPATTRFPWE